MGIPARLRAGSITFAAAGTKQCGSGRNAQATFGMVVSLRRSRCLGHLVDQLPNVIGPLFLRGIF